MIWISSPNLRRLSATVLQIVNHQLPFEQTTRHIVRAVSPTLTYQSTCLVLRGVPAVMQVSHRGKRYEANRDSDYKEIYRFSHIRLTRLLSNLKLYQTGLTVLAAPIVFYSQSCGYITAADTSVFIGITTFACLMLYIMSGFFRKIVCILYLNEKKQIVEVSHLTFMGRRNDVKIDLKDIVPLNDTAEKTSSFYVKLKTYSTGQKFYLFLNQGKINEIDSFKNVVGLKLS